MADTTTSKNILETVTSFIGDVYDDAFDTELIISISGFLNSLVQVNVGQNIDLLSDPSLTWDDFFGAQVGNRSNAIMYVCYNTKLAFNPPLPATIAAMTAAKDEAFWRARLEFDTV